MKKIKFLNKTKNKDNENRRKQMKRSAHKTYLAAVLAFLDARTTIMLKEEAHSDLSQLEAQR